MAPGTSELEVIALGYRTITSGSVIVSPDSESRVAIAMDAEPLRVERLVVTANKIALSSQEIAAFTSVVDQEDVQARGDLELVDALENLTGIMHTAQAGSFESIELRGMPRGGNAFETTLLLIDGVPAGHGTRKEGGGVSRGRARRG